MIRSARINSSLIKPAARRNQSHRFSIKLPIPTASRLARRYFAYITRKIYCIIIYGPQFHFGQVMRRRYIHPRFQTPSYLIYYLIQSLFTSRLYYTSTGTGKNLLSPQTLPFPQVRISVERFYTAQYLISTPYDF